MKITEGVPYLQQVNLKQDDFFQGKEPQSKNHHNPHTEFYMRSFAWFFLVRLAPQIRLRMFAGKAGACPRMEHLKGASLG